MSRLVSFCGKGRGATARNSLSGGGFNGYGSAMFSPPRLVATCGSFMSADADLLRHPAFVAFETAQKPDEDTVVDWLGARWRKAWFNADDPNARDTPADPRFDEEAFEWISLLEALAAARGRFVMLELGAGYGRWGVRGALAARRLGLQPFVRFVEAEPQHLAWAREAATLNGLGAAETDFVDRAVYYGEAKVPFTISSLQLRARNWYGQAVWWEQLTPSSKSYHGYQVHDAESGCEEILVATTTLEELTSDLEIVDYIDMDLQTAELGVVKNSLETLTSKVKRVHIATHSREIEVEIRLLFLDAGWTQRWDYACLRHNVTPFGALQFGDGVQSWINPRFAIAEGSGAPES